MEKFCFVIRISSWNGQGYSCSRVDDVYETLDGAKRRFRELEFNETARLVTDENDGNFDLDDATLERFRYKKEMNEYTDGTLSYSLSSPSGNSVIIEILRKKLLP